MKGTRAVAVLGVLAVLGAALLAVPTGWSAPQWWAPPALVAGVAVGQWQAARVVIGRQGMSFALGDVLLGIALVAHPGAWVIPSLAVGLGIGLVATRVAPLKIWFNVAQAAFGSSVAAWLAVHSTGGVWGAAAGLVAFVALNQLSIAVAIKLTTGQQLLPILRGPGPIGLLHTLGNVSVGLLAGWLATNHPVGLLGLAAPLALLLWSYHQQTERTAEARLYAEIAHRRESATSGSLDASAQVVVTAAARIFGGAEVELLLRHPEGPVRYLGDENGLCERVRVESTAFAAPWALRTLGTQAVLTGADGDRPFCSAVLGDVNRPTGVFVARRPPRAGGFTRLDARLAEVLVGQAEGWLSTADLLSRHDSALSQVAALSDATRALGDIGAYTAPSLLVLRESTDRLSRLATTFTGPDPVNGIVEELHTVERAVASLLGAIALATEEHAIRDSAPSRTTAERRAPEVWTSTGVLAGHDFG